MIISKRKLEKLIQQRIEEREKEEFLHNRICELERDLHSRIDRLSEAVWRLEESKKKQLRKVTGDGKI